MLSQSQADESLADLKEVSLQDVALVRLVSDCSRNKSDRLTQAAQHAVSELPVPALSAFPFFLWFDKLSERWLLGVPTQCHQVWQILCEFVAEQYTFRPTG
jgi:hypothetical protein